MAELPDPKPQEGGLTDDEKLFADILIHNAAKLALVRTALDGKPAAALAMVWHQDDGGATIVPVAVLVDKNLFERLTDPAKEVAR